MLAWTLFVAATIVAVVSFATHGIDPKAIYGLRFTPGWTGFGPFPNRNHTACFLAMGTVMGAGCIAWAGTKRNYGVLALAVLAVAVIFVALLETHSRGGLVGLGAGLAVFLGLTLLKMRTHRALGVVVAVGLMAGAVALMFGGATLARFSSGDASGGVSTGLRLAVWHDAFAMWRDARWLGHGAGSFASIFPMYESMNLDMQSVIHPESSWLQWLTELGLVPVLLGAVGFVAIAVRATRESFASHSGFFLRIAGIAAAVGLLVHGIIDVPAHRWGTAGFALAALALACPRPVNRVPEVRTRKAALVPLAAAAFWVLPFLCDAPLWSPLELDRVIDREMSTGRVPFATLESALRCFPLNPALHEAIGLRLVDDARETAAWQRHFRIATRLVPGSWALPRQQARACVRFAPSLALHYWQIVVERGGHRTEELFGEALQQTEHLPNSAALWEGYVEAHPELALVYASRFPGDEGRRFFDLWWRERALAEVALHPREASDFYRVAARWSSPEEFQKWITRRSDLESTDFRAWAALLHGWNDDEAAWRLLSRRVDEPPFPTAPPRFARPDLEARWHRDESDYVNARSLVQTLAVAGEAEAAQQIILTVALRENAPAWFIRKAAYALVARGQTGGGGGDDAAREAG